ncbi:MAG: chalcone isomerase family protein [Myxococcota bacterium]|nr:chalcone isomerase family protein [Myxococcota bacterium]
MSASLLFRATTTSLVVLLLTVPARAGELGGVRLEDSLSLDGKQLLLNGLSLRTATVLKVHVYVIGLYLEERSQDDEQIIESTERKRVVMYFVHDVGAKDLRKGWEDGFRKNTRDREAIRAQFDAFQAAMRDVSEGERLVLDFVDEKVQVRYGDQLAATIEGRDFQKGLMACWMGPKPLTQELKAGLLGRS